MPAFTDAQQWLVSLKKSPPYIPHCEQWENEWVRDKGCSAALLETESTMIDFDIGIGMGSIPTDHCGRKNAKQLTMLLVA